MSKSISIETTLTDDRLLSLSAEGLAAEIERLNAKASALASIAKVVKQNLRKAKGRQSVIQSRAERERAADAQLEVLAKVRASLPPTASPETVRALADLGNQLVIATAEGDTEVMGLIAQKMLAIRNGSATPSA